MRLVVAGTPEVAVPSLIGLAGSRHRIAAVVTRPDTVAGRGRKAVRSPVGNWADAAGIPVLQPARPSEPEFLAALTELAPDCCPVVAYGALVPAAALAIPAHGWVNLHFSLLPAWRGAAPVQHALMAGDPFSGASHVPAGDRPGHRPGVRGDDRDRAAPGHGRRPARPAGRGGAELLVRTLDGIEDGSLEARTQPAEGISLAPKITVADAEVDWTLPAAVIDRRVRGCTPNPGAWTTWRGERLGLGPVLPLDVTAGLPTDLPAPGEDVPLRPGKLRVGKRSVDVGTGRGTLRLGEVRPAGKKAMQAADWARGVRPGDQERLG